MPDPTPLFITLLRAAAIGLFSTVILVAITLIYLWHHLHIGLS